MESLPVPEINEFKKLPIFKRISDFELNNMRELISRKKYLKDEYIIIEDAPGDMFFVLLTGSLYVVKRINESSQEVLNLLDQPGDLFGEMSLMEDKPRCAGVIAAENSEVLVITKGDFLNLVHRFPRFTLEVARNISNYLRRTDQKLIDLLREKNEQLNFAYKKLQETQEELLRSERLSLVGRMAATILHDLKNPISTISGYAQLIKTGKYPEEKVEKFAGIIEQEVERFLSMTQELLSFSSGEGRLHLSKVNLGQFLTEMVNSMSHKFQDHGVSVQTKFNYDGQVIIDSARLRRALENIANNAIDAMSAGGKFVIETEKPLQSTFNIIFSDNGHGMTNEVKNRIFDEFFTFGKSTGTGLGLTITKKIITEHRGKIEVESEPGVGSKFIIQLPL